jgi:Methylase involved in ubiquinone/menaquinone biosynthesis
MTEWTDDDTSLFLRYGDAFVPRRREQIHVVRVLLHGLVSPQILDLGCGPGLLAAEILREHPSVKLTGVDASDEMLAVARSHLAPFGERVRLIQSDLDSPAWQNGRYGAVVTSLAVHHLDDDGKRRLFQAVYSTLEPGGVFVQADLVRPATPVATVLASDQWNDAVEYQSSTLYGGTEASQAFRKSCWNTFEHPDEVDKPASLFDQLTWLAETGFVDIDVIWVFAGHAIITATRPNGEQSENLAR